MGSGKAALRLSRSGPKASLTREGGIQDQRTTCGSTRSRYLWPSPTRRTTFLNYEIELSPFSWDVPYSHSTRSYSSLFFQNAFVFPPSLDPCRPFPLHLSQFAVCLRSSIFAISRLLTAFRCPNGFNVLADKARVGRCYLQPPLIRSTSFAKFRSVLREIDFWR
jgi:hypothetical protein